MRHGNRSAIAVGQRFNLRCLSIKVDGKKGSSE